MPVLNTIKPSTKNFIFEQTPLFKSKKTLPNYKKLSQKTYNSSQNDCPFVMDELFDRAEKIKYIKAKLKSGDYTVEASKVAEAMLKDLVLNFL